MGEQSCWGTLEHDCCCYSSFQMNGLQEKIKRTTQKMMALIAELSMNQAGAIKLQQEMRDKEQFLIYITSRLQKGLPPPKEVENEWLKVLRDEEVHKAATEAKAKVSLCLDSYIKIIWPMGIPFNIYKCMELPLWKLPWCSDKVPDDHHQAHGHHQLVVAASAVGILHMLILNRTATLVFYPVHKGI